MTIALLSHTYKQGDSSGSGTSSAIDTTGASLLIAYVADFTGSSAATLADSAGNTWTALTARPLSGNMRSQMYYCASPTTSASHTFSANGAATYAALAVSAYSGTAASPYDQENGSTTLTGTSLATGSVTPSEDNELVIYGAGYASSALSVSVGTMLETAVFIGGTSYGIGLAHEIQTTATARSPSWSWSSTNSCSTTIATFKAAAGGTSLTPGAGSVAITGHSPTVDRTAHVALTPGAGSLAITGYAPTVAQGASQAANPGVGSVAITGYAPTVDRTANQALTAGVGSVSITGYAPTVQQTSASDIIPGAGSVSLTGYAPSVAQTANVALVPDVGALAITGYAPSVTQGNPSPSLVPGVGSLTITGYAPTVEQSVPGGGMGFSMSRMRRLVKIRFNGKLYQAFEEQIPELLETLSEQAEQKIKKKRNAKAKPAPVAVVVSAPADVLPDLKSRIADVNRSIGVLWGVDEDEDEEILWLML